MWKTETEQVEELKKYLEYRIEQLSGINQKELIEMDSHYLNEIQKENEESMESNIKQEKD